MTSRAAWGLWPWLMVAALSFGCGLLLGRRSGVSLDTWDMSAKRLHTALRAVRESLTVHEGSLRSLRDTLAAERAQQQVSLAAVANARQRASQARQRATVLADSLAAVATVRDSVLVLRGTVAALEAAVAAGALVQEGLDTALAAERRQTGVLLARIARDSLRLAQTAVHVAGLDSLLAVRPGRGCRVLGIRCPTLVVGPGIGLVAGAMRPQAVAVVLGWSLR